MENVKNRVIVWSIDDFNTMGLMRELGRSGLNILFLINGRAGMAAKSKYCVSYVETASVADGFVYLENNFREEQAKPILIISSDEIMTYVDRNRERLADRYILPGAGCQGDTEKYIDKNNMTALACEIGFLCPQSRKMAYDSPVDDISYPCLIKPSHQKPGHYNEFKYRICRSRAALKRTLRFVRRDSQFILQQYIPKELDLLIYGGRMWDGKTVIAGAMIRDRWADSGSSSHGYLAAEIPSCADTGLIAEFLERIDYHGLFSVEYGMLRDQAYFFEVNLRNDGTSHYFYQAGANIPLAYVYSCAGLDYTQIPLKVEGKRWFADEVFDVENVITGKISRKIWKKDKAEATVFKYYDPEDPEPYFFVKKGSKKQILQDLVLKRFRLYIVFVLDKLGLRK